MEVVANWGVFGGNQSDKVRLIDLKSRTLLETLVPSAIKHVSFLVNCGSRVATREQTRFQESVVGFGPDHSDSKTDFFRISKAVRVSRNDGNRLHSTKRLGESRSIFFVKLKEQFTADQMTFHK